MTKLGLGICGLGTVGAGVVNVLQRNKAAIDARAGCSIVVEHVGARRDNPDCVLDGIKTSRDIFEVVDNPDVDVVVELIGGYEPARELVLRAIANGKHVVTANKALIAVHGDELAAAAANKGVALCFEASVAGGIPVIKALREGLAANSVEWLAGIINGTGNYILSEMRDKERAFADVLADAQALGYAEADPAFDIEGTDAAHKLTILASLAFAMPLAFDQCYTQGITAIEIQDIRFADELGYRIKHLGIARRQGSSVELRVHPTLVPQGRLLANVDGVMNAVLIKGDAVGPTLYYGAGAGAEPTASAVLADVIDIARSLGSAGILDSGISSSTNAQADIMPMGQVETAYYLRLNAEDKAGVLNKITRVLSDANISIEAMKQPEPIVGAADVPIVLVTNISCEKNMLAAINDIETLDEVSGAVTFIRIESLG